MKNFVFDLYNTLIEVKTDEHCKEAWKSVVAYFGSLGINTDWKTLCDGFDEYWRVFNAKTTPYAYPECDCVEQFRFIAQMAGGDISREKAKEALCIMRKASIRILRAFDGARAILDELRNRGARLYLLTNAQAAFTRDEIELCGLSGAFDGMLLSSECGCRKPDPAFFDMLFKKYKLQKSDTVMIGDDVFSDGKGAADYGIRFVLARGGAAAHSESILALSEAL